MQISSAHLGKWPSLALLIAVVLLGASLLSYWLEWQKPDFGKPAITVTQSTSMIDILPPGYAGTLYFRSATKKDGMIAIIIAWLTRLMLVVVSIGNFLIFKTSRKSFLSWLILMPCSLVSCCVITYLAFWPDGISLVSDNAEFGWRLRRMHLAGPLLMITGMFLEVYIIWYLVRIDVLSFDKRLK